MTDDAQPVTPLTTDDRLIEVVTAALSGEAKLASTLLMEFARDVERAGELWPNVLAQAIDLWTNALRAMAQSMDVPVQTMWQAMTAAVQLARHEDEGQPND
jgi:Na+/phosphate symporter